MRVQVGIFTQALRGSLNDHVIDRDLGAATGVALGVLGLGVVLILLGAR